MTDIESMIDKRISQAAEYYRRSDTNIKYVAIIAGNVVGTYGDGATQAIADKIQRSVATVQNYAHAYWQYQKLRYAIEDTKHIRKLWRKLPVSHWWLVYDNINSCVDAAYYLSMAEVHKWSGRRMLAEFRADYEAQNGALPPVTPAKQLQRARNVVQSILLEVDKYTPAIVEWAKAGKVLFEEAA